MFTDMTVKEIKNQSGMRLGNLWDVYANVPGGSVRVARVFRAHGDGESIYDLPGHLEVARLYNGRRLRRLDLSEVDKLIDDLYPEGIRVQQLVDGPIHPHLPVPSRKPVRQPVTADQGRPALIRLR
jgi:hypothetical protein